MTTIDPQALVMFIGATGCVAGRLVEGLLKTGIGFMPRCATQRIARS